MLTREQITLFVYRFRKFDVTKQEQRQRLIDSFVNAVYLYEDKIILTFNYKDGSKTITLGRLRVEIYPYSVHDIRKIDTEWIILLTYSVSILVKSIIWQFSALKLLEVLGKN